MEFLRALIAFLAENGVLPPEVKDTDTDREKTYLQYLPASPERVSCVRLYDTSLPTLVDKQAGVHRIQVTMRDPKHARVIRDIHALWVFLMNRPTLVEDISPDYWVIFDVQSGPIPLGQDEKGNYLYSLNFPVKTKMF